MLRYFVTYRWEMWLIIGIPAVLGVVRTLSFPHISNLLNDLVGIFDAGSLVVVIPVNLLLLSVSYLRVRRLEREFLTSLWRYSIAVAVIGAVSVIAVIGVGDAYPTAPRLVTNLLVEFTSLLHFLALLWFARQLSKTSLPHAFFLVAFSPLHLFIPLSLYQFIPIPGSLWDGISAEVGWAANLRWSIGFVGLLVMLIKVWLLRNFDRRGDRFRKEAVIILAAVVVLSYCAKGTLSVLLNYLGVPSEAILPLLGFTAGFMIASSIDIVFTVLMLFGVVYLVRVRRPKPDATPVPASNR